MSPSQRLRLASDLAVTVRDLVLAGLRQRLPLADHEELRLRLATIYLGGDLGAKVCAYTPPPSGE